MHESELKSQKSIQDRCELSSSVRCALEGWPTRMTTGFIGCSDPYCIMYKAIHLGPVTLNEAPDQVQSSILAASIYHGTASSKPSEPPLDI